MSPGAPGGAAPPGGPARASAGGGATATVDARPVPPPGAGTRRRVGPARSWWPLVTTKLLELRKRRALMIVIALLVAGFPVIVLGIRLIVHAADPTRYGPAGSPGVFEALVDPMAAFGFIAAATLGATAGTSDLSEGFFRHLVVTGRSRVALYLARIPAGLAILLPLVTAAFAGLCLVTAFAGTPQPRAVQVNGVSIPLNLDRAQLEHWLVARPDRAEQAFRGGPAGVSGVSVKGSPQAGKPVQIQPVQPFASPAAAAHFVRTHISEIDAVYTGTETAQLNPAVNEMVKVGLWLVLYLVIGFVVGLGLASLTGQRTVATIAMIVLEIILTPILVGTVIPYFLNGQRVVVGVAMDQLRPALLTASSGHHGPFGGGLGIPPMPTWAMVAVIVGWIVGWTVIGAWRMATRDA